MQDKYFVPVNTVVIRGKTYEAESVYKISTEVIPELFDLMKEGKVQTYSKVHIKQVNNTAVETSSDEEKMEHIEHKKKPKGYNL